MEPRAQHEELSSMLSPTHRVVDERIAVATEVLLVAQAGTERAVEGGHPPLATSAGSAEDRLRDGSGSGRGILLGEEQRRDHRWNNDDYPAALEEGNKSSD